jgi:hypothetical protein
VDELCRVIAALSEDVRSQMQGNAACVFGFVFPAVLGSDIVGKFYFSALRCWELSRCECAIPGQAPDRNTLVRLEVQLYLILCIAFHCHIHTAMPVPATLLRLLLNGLDGTVNDAKERLSYW